MIYLDNNATTACDPRVIAAIADEFSLGPFNPASQHAIGRSAASKLDECMVRIGACLGSEIDVPGGARLILTSGGTESNNLALAGLGESDWPLVVSAIEHASVLAYAEQAQKSGRDVFIVPVSSDGMIDTTALETILSQIHPRRAVVSVMSANNETGVIQPIAEVARLCQAAAAMLHVDATQSFGKIPATINDIPAQAITITSHKFYGPTGVGALWIGPGIKLRPLLFGGEQQLLTRPGTVPVPLAVGMTLALEIAVENLSESRQQLVSQQQRLESALLENSAQILIHGSNVNRLPGTSCVSFPGTDRQSMLMALDMAGIAASSGSACSSGSSPPSHVLTAMGAEDWAIQSAIRFGSGRFSTEEEIDESARRICRVYNRLRS